MVFTNRFIILVLLGIIPFALKEFNSYLGYLGVLYNVALFILSLVDYFTIVGSKQIHLSRQYERSFSKSEFIRIPGKPEQCHGKGIYSTGRVHIHTSEGGSGRLVSGWYRRFYINTKPTGSG